MNSLKANILFNLLGGGILLVVVGYILTSYFTTEAVPLCSTRYSNGFQMSYVDHSGKLLSPQELAARSSARQWGFNGNTSAVAIKGETFNNALKIKLDAIDTDEGSKRNGVGFIWRPSELARVQAACLGYSVFIPGNYNFPESGYFPGFFGTANLSDIDEPRFDDAFSLRARWQPSGDLGIEARLPGETGRIIGASRRTVWPKGKWVQVEQEVRLNEKDKANGAFRLWVDGKLVVDRSEITLRKNPQAGISGVLAEVGYGRLQAASTTMGLSPLVLRW